MRAEYGLRSYYEYLEKEWEAHGSWEVMPERDRSSSLLRATPPFPCIHCRFTHQKRTFHNLQQLYIAGSTPWASKALSAGSEDNRQYIFLPQFTLVSRCRARDEKFLSLKTRSQASSAIVANSVSSLPQQRLDPSGGGQMIAPILSRKRDNRERSFFPQKKDSQWTHSIPSRTERACSSPKHITHRLCVSSSVRKRWHGSTHLLKRFSTDIFLLTLQKQGPLKEKRGWCVPQVPFYARRCSLACVIGVHLPMSSALGGFNHASGNRSRWRRSHSVP